MRGVVVEMEEDELSSYKMSAHMSRSFFRRGIEHDKIIMKKLKDNILLYNLHRSGARGTKSTRLLLEDREIRGCRTTT